MPATFGITDLFAGPGGLGEGFSSLSVDQHNPFNIGISVEKDASAHKTLRLRAFLRAYYVKHGKLPDEFVTFHAGAAGEPDWASVDAGAWSHASKEARQLELGKIPASEAIDEAIANLRKFDDTILIGGPPCQAYSLVGRARSRGKPDYVPEQDERHFLFREYIRVLERLRPAAFVMENVKGMLSSTVESRRVFEMFMEDLSSLGTKSGHLYDLFAVHVENGEGRLRQAKKPSDFVVKAEEFGVPQRRHRVIIIGIRADLASRASAASIAVNKKRRTVNDAIGNLGHLRSGISGSGDTFEQWNDHLSDWARTLAFKSDVPLEQPFRTLVSDTESRLPLPRSSESLPSSYGTSNDELLRWLERPELRSIAQHATRGHMASDLGRYLFAAVFGKVHGYSPKASEFPEILRPNHRNWDSGIFADRFRVQLANEASTTVTSHISKDGHYFIHPDPAQCRSLTVREAARLQTFPDDYLFMGNRTQQYVQVGNAVPPFLARQIANLVYASLTSTNL
ncbi:DNA cytosine methyltransferase [Rhizobium leguminosarum]|uniref:DNA cytosine methyltransferase n=1 Tax=Rhizobium leguminosarum TaxID=384 RepID=UPI001AE28FA8|nr:DNA (cytosine-5-)-methyltransferase [Rhizobium leguminosarum]MBP2443793.1 DNA (cytosine-5)-methyltransferase 1 [Rhizobium leguminosarum]